MPTIKDRNTVAFLQLQNLHNIHILEKLRTIHIMHNMIWDKTFHGLQVPLTYIFDSGESIFEVR